MWKLQTNNRPWSQTPELQRLKNSAECPSWEHQFSSLEMQGPLLQTWINFIPSMDK